MKNCSFKIVNHLKFVEGIGLIFSIVMIIAILLTQKSIDVFKIIIIISASIVAIVNAVLIYFNIKNKSKIPYFDVVNFVLFVSITIIYFIQIIN